MNFNTTNSTFRQLLGNGLTYRVPAFQRDYSWGEEEWDDLWQDICALFEEHGEAAHYMGYLVLQSVNNKRFDIIDGQQRLTTLSLLILAGLKHLEDLIDANLDPADNAKRRDQLRNSYIGYVDPVSLVALPKLELNRHSNKFYQTYLVPLEKLPMRGLNPSEHQLRRAFLWFRDVLDQKIGRDEDSGRELARFLDALVDKLFFTVITVNDELNAFKVFETLNARGVRLSATDLLKNYLFSIISKEDSHETELSALEGRWERIVGLLGAENFSDFLRVFWNSRHNLVRKADLFKTIRSHVSGREQVFALMRELDFAAGVFAALRDPSDPNWNVEESKAFSSIQLFNVTQPLAMLLAAHARFFESDRKTFSRIVRVTAVISMRYNVICSLPTHEQERVYNDVALGISSGRLSSGAAIVDALSEVYPDDQVFRSSFASKEFRTTDSGTKRLVRYILRELERQVSGANFELEGQTYNIEHILPQNPSEDWSHITEAKQDRLIYRLGNMTLLESKANRNAGNESFESKSTVYASSDFQITRSIPEQYPIWDEQSVESRQRQLAKLAIGIWKL